MKKKQIKKTPNIKTVDKIVVIKRALGKQTGATLVEILIVAILLLMIMTAGLYVLNARIQVTQSVEISKEAELAGESGITALTAAFNTLTDSSSFSAENESNLVLENCSPQTCDYILSQDDANLNTSPAKGVPYGSTIPAGNGVVFIRRWKVETINADYNLKRISVAVLKDEQSTRPELLLKTVVSQAKVE